MTLLRIRQIEPGDKCTGFSLGDAQFQPLKTFLTRDAHSFHADNLAKTYVAVIGGQPPEVVAYVTLVCGQIEANGATLDDPSKYRYAFFPAIKIARLAVHKEYRKDGLGTALVDLAVGVAQANIMPSAGCRFMVVDAKRPAVPFYERRGFTIIDTQENRGRKEPVMFLDLHKAALG